MRPPTSTRRSIWHAAGRVLCPVQLTGLVDRLHARGLLERRAGEADRRVKHLTLTAAGQRLRAELEARLFAGRWRDSAGATSRHCAICCGPRPQPAGGTSGRIYQGTVDFTEDKQRDRRNRSACLERTGRKRLFQYRRLDARSPCPGGGGCEIRTREGLPPTRFPTMLACVHQSSPPSVTWTDRDG